MKRFWAVFWPVAKFPAFLEAKFARIQCHLVVFGFCHSILDLSGAWDSLRCECGFVISAVLQTWFFNFWGSWRSLSIAIHVLMVWGWGNAKPPPCQKAVLVELLKAVDMNRTSGSVIACCQWFNYQIEQTNIGKAWQMTGCPASPHQTSFRSADRTQRGCRHIAMPLLGCALPSWCGAVLCS